MLGLALLAATLLGQEFERAICIPDSFARLEYPTHVVANPVNGLLYVGGEEDSCIVVVDPATGARVGRIDVSDDCSGLFVNPARNKLYYLDWMEMVLTAIDCASGRVTGSVPVYDDLVGFCPMPSVGKVYVLNTDGEVFVLDDSTDELLTSLEFYGFPWGETDRIWLAGSAELNRVWFPCEGHYGSWLNAIDCGTDSVVDSIPVGDYDCCFYALCYDSLNRLLHCLYDDWRSGHMKLLMLDAVSGDSVAVVELECENDLWPSAMVCNPFSNTLYCSYLDEGLVDIVDVANRRYDRSHNLGWEVFGMELDPVHRQVCALGSDWNELGVVWLVDAVTNRLDAEVRLPDYPRADWWPFSLAMVPGSGHAATVGEGWGELMVVDTQSESLVATVQLTMDIEDIALHPARGKLYCDGSPGGLWVVALDGAAPATTLAGVADVRGMLLVPETDRLYFGAESDDEETRLLVLDCATDSILDTLAEGGWNDYRLCYCPEVNKLYASRGWDVDVFDCATNELATTVEVRDCDGLVYDSVAGRVLAWHGRGWDAIDPSIDSVVSACTTGCSGIFALDPVTRRVCVNQRGMELAVLDADSGTEVARFFLQREPTCVAWSRTSGLLYCGLEYEAGLPGTLLRLDVAADSILDSLQVECGTPRELLHSPFSDLLYVSGGTGTTVIDCRANCPVATEPGGYAYSNYPTRVILDESTGRTYINRRGHIAVFRDTPRPYAVEGRFGPTLVGRNVTLNGVTGADLLDITGRRVGMLRPGPNLLDAVPAGIYFVRRRETDYTQKVIITN